MRRDTHKVAGLDIEIVYPEEPDYNIPRPITRPQILVTGLFVAVIGIAALLGLS